VRRSESGFTLLEVLAAVLLLGTVYTVLAGVAIRGLRSEGTALRRLEASLIADRELSAIELQIESGIFPVNGPEEEERDIFVITFSDEDFELPIPPSEDGRNPDGGIGSLLSENTPGTGVALRRYEIRIGWLEGLAEYEVVRTTYGFDAAVLADLLPIPSDLGGLGGLGGLGDGLGGSSDGESALGGGSENNPSSRSSDSPGSDPNDRRSRFRNRLRDDDDEEEELR
jgi:prepilin-type N-terminal cleavage/methylation domain-containing protein